MGFGIGLGRGWQGVGDGMVLGMGCVWGMRWGWEWDGVGDGTDLLRIATVC